MESADIRWGALVESPLLCTQVRKHSVQKQMSYARVYQPLELFVVNFDSVYGVIGAKNWLKSTLNTLASLNRQFPVFYSTFNFCHFSRKR
jgi:hypothetical protein